jgi:hypothetical protein
MSGEFDKLIQNIEKLEKTNFDSGLTIEKFLLPDKEAIKKYIATLNPQMSPDDIDLMVDGAEELYKKIEEKIENKKKSKEEKEKGVTGSETTGASQSATTENPDSNEPTNPSDEKEKRRQELKAKKEAEKEKRKKEIKEYVDLMKKIFPEEYKQIKEIEKKVKEIKLELKTAFFTLKNKLQELTSKLINSLIAAAVAIPAAVLKLSLPPFNVPDAIKGMLALVQNLLDLIAVIKDVIPFLKPIRYLPLVTTKDNLAILGTIMNPIIEAIFALLAPIQGFENIIFTLLNALLSFIANLKESNFKKATKKLKKLGHLKKLDLPLPEIALNLITKVFWGTDNRGKKYDYDGDPPGNEGERLKLSDNTEVTVYSFSPDDIPEIIGLLDTFVVRNNRVVAYRQKIDFEGKKLEPEDLLVKLTNELENAALPIEVKDTSEFEQFVYDIKLPDGTVVLGISEEAVEFYKSKYTLNFVSGE